MIKVTEDKKLKSISSLKSIWKAKENTQKMHLSLDTWLDSEI